MVQWFFQRHIQHPPTAGEMVFCDRSRHSGSGVERVMGFCTPNAFLELMREVPKVERMHVRSGMGPEVAGSRSRATTRARTGACSSRPIRSSSDGRVASSTAPSTSREARCPATRAECARSERPEAAHCPLQPLATGALRA
ncbi:MAG: hypothetical protein ACK4MT_10595 [Thermaurantiacus tibetensis]